MTVSTTERWNLPLPPNSTLIATFPQMVRHQSNELEKRLPPAITGEVHTQLAPTVTAMSDAKANASQALTLSTRATTRQNALESRQADLESRQAGLELIAGTDPEGLTDGTVQNLVANTATATRAAVEAAATERLAPTTVFSRDYCTEDGVTDDGPGLLAALQDLVAAGGGDLVLTPGRPRLVNTAAVVTVTDPRARLRIIGTGAPILAGPDVVEVIGARGTMAQLSGGDAAYTAPVLGATTLNVAADLRAELTPGDWIMVWSSDVDNPERPTQYMSGEEARVKTVTAGALTLDRPIRLARTAGATRRLYRLNLAQTPRFVDLDVTLNDAGARQIALQVEYAYRPETTGFRATGRTGRYGVRYSQVIGGRINGSEVTDLYDAANGAGPNGIAHLLNGCIGVVVDGALGTRVRHGFDVNSYSSPGLPGLVSRDNVTNDTGGVETYSAPTSIHHARGTILNRPIAINCGGGVHTRGFNTTIRDFTPVGGQAAKPAEWDGTRHVPSGIAVGETDSLPAGEGGAGEGLVIENYDPRLLRADWAPISWADRRGPGTSITGPTFVDVPGVIMSDSAVRPNGPLGNADLALGGIVGYSANWEWQQGSAGVVIQANKFHRPTGSISTTRTPVVVPANIDVSAVWEARGNPSVGNCLFGRGSEDGTLSAGYFLAVAADGTATLGKRVAGNSTTLATSTAGAVVAGDLVTLRMHGRSIIALVNGLAVASALDASVKGPGRAGFWFRNAGGDGWYASRFRIVDLDMATAV